MSFKPDNLVLCCPIYPPSPSVLPVPITPVPGIPQEWNYQAGLDTIANVEAAGYFVYFANWHNDSNYNQGRFLQVGDNINCVCSDGDVNLTVTAISPQITTQPFAIPAGSITTADLANQAVTAPKIANATITTAQISATAGILGTQLANNTITATQIANATITSTQIANATITGNKLAANTVTSGDLAFNTIQYLALPMTAAQWNGMNAAPFLLIAAGGAHTLITLNECALEVIFGTQQFAGGGVVAIQYGPAAAGAGVAASGTIAAATVTGWAGSSVIGLTGTIANGASANVINQGLYISNDTAAFTTGDSTFVLHLWYSVSVTTL